MMKHSQGTKNYPLGDRSAVLLLHKGLLLEFLQFCSKIWTSAGYKDVSFSEPCLQFLFPEQTVFYLLLPSPTHKPHTFLSSDNRMNTSYKQKQCLQEVGSLHKTKKSSFYLGIYLFISGLIYVTFSNFFQATRTRTEDDLWLTQKKRSRATT